MEVIADDGSIDEAAIRATIRELVSELAPSDAIESVSAEHRLVEDLECHSLALLELAFTLEDEFGLESIDEETVEEIVTVGDVETHVIDELRHKHAPG